MQPGLVAQRTQFSSCDECRRLRVRCGVRRGNASGTVSCSRCLKRHRQCTFEWIADPKRQSRKAPQLVEDPSSRLQPGLGSSDTPVFHGTGAATVSDLERLGLVDSNRLQEIYLEGFDALFGSWMSRYGCPFLSKGGLGNHHTNIADVCIRLDQWMRDTIQGETLNGFTQQTDEEYRLADESLRNAIGAFSARWLPTLSGNSDVAGSFDVVAHTLWRYVRRDMLRMLNRPSYRSMLSLFLFALTPVPIGIPDEEELDGISGQVCVHGALQQIQIMRARQRSLQFNGTNVQTVVLNASASIPELVGDTNLIDAENVAYWAALTFDTSASLTLNCRPLLSSGLFGYQEELPWRLVESGAIIFQNEMEDVSDKNSYHISDQVANKIIASATAWKLLVWKSAAVFKEALRDGYDQSEVTRAFSRVVEVIQQFNDTYRTPLEAFHRRMPFLGQQTKFRWYSLMLHYYLSILLFVNALEDNNCSELLVGIEKVSADALNETLNTLTFGLNNTITFSAKSDTRTFPPTQPVTVPLLFIDPYQHHIVAAVGLVHRALERDLAFGKIKEDTHEDLHNLLEKILDALPQSSKSVKIARDTFPPRKLN